jgi:hypothetical protein
MPDVSLEWRPSPTVAEDRSNIKAGTKAGGGGPPGLAVVRRAGAGSGGAGVQPAGRLRHL